MIQPITSAEFRQNMKSFLDAAETRDIHIARGWKMYKLTFLGNTFGELDAELRDKLKTQPRAERIVKSLPAQKIETLTTIPGVVRASELLDTHCKGEHYMSRKNCGKIGCPWTK